MKQRALILFAMTGLGTAALAGDNLLNDPGFEALSGQVVTRAARAGEWSIPPGEPYADNLEVKADAASARSGKVGLKLHPLALGRLPAVRQTIPQLAAGIYEFKVWAKGTGVLVLQAASLRRRGDLTKEWAEYSVTFAQPQAGPADLMILVDGTAQVDDASFTPAAAERQAAWKEQEQARAEYGFVPEYFAAQSPQPGAPVKPAGTFHGGPVAWREKVVFYDKTYDAVWVTHPETVAQYLGANGFQVLGAAAFGEWMKKAVREGAYGTVCVMTHGLCPGAVYTPGATYDDPKVKDSLIRKYLDAGGRVVWLGEMPFYYLQDDVHPQISGIATASIILGVRLDSIAGNKTGPRIVSLGQAWGLAAPGSSPCAAYPEDVTAVLSSIDSDHAATEMAMAWFKNFNPLCPWSGFIYPYRSDDLANPALQESVYRLALYAGQPVAAPAGITVAAKAAAAPFEIVLDPPRNRHAYYRGEKIPVRLELGATPGPAVERNHHGETDAGDGVPPNGSLGRVVGGTASPRSALLGKHSLQADAGDGVPPNGRTDGRLRLNLVRDGKSFPVGECPPPTKAAPSRAEIATADLACGEYRLTAQAVTNGAATVVGETTVSLCPRPEDPTFFFGAKGANMTFNPARQEMVVNQFVAAGMNLGALTTETAPYLFDLALEHGLRFSLRAHGNPQLSDAERAEAEQRGPNGEKIAGAWEGGRPILGLLDAKRRQLDAAAIAGQVKELCAWPAAWPRCESCDDFAVYYGWDYSALARRLFKEKTGLDAPVPPELVKLKEQFKSCGLVDGPKGIVPDNDPWLQWSVFTTKDIAGGYNKAVTEAGVQAVPDLKIGPVPGGMQLPIYVPGQYPPHSFGANGFNLLDYYYYLNYWQPEIGNLYWDDLARLNNRDLELWTSPGCIEQTDATYFRNTFFLHLAGGCQGIYYYQYSEATPVAWTELGRLGRTVVRPLSPLLGKLRPIQTENALLLPYTQFAHTPYYPATALYAYGNLLGAHLDIQPTCEEEVLSGYIKNYKTILLWHVEWLRAAVVKALEDYIAGGGVVLADSTTIVPIKGAIKLPVDLAMGDKQSKPDVNDPRLGGPGIRDYLHPDRVADIGKAIAPYARPWAECADPTLIVRRQAYHGVSYLWLVNIHSEAEYEYIRPRTYGLSESYQLANPEKAKKELDQYLAERAGQRFAPRVTIPAGHWAAYDVLRGQRVPLQNEGQRLAFTADMERLGGTLIALYPEPIARVTVAASGARGWFGLGAVRVARGQAATVRVTVRGASGQPLAGTQPLAVTVTTPQGEWAEVTGAHTTADGVWSTAIHPAINDPPGTWNIRVKELSSGLTAATTLRVR